MYQIHPDLDFELLRDRQEAICRQIRLENAIAKRPNPLWARLIAPFHWGRHLFHQKYKQQVQTMPGIVTDRRIAL